MDRGRSPSCEVRGPTKPIQSQHTFRQEDSVTNLRKMRTSVHGLCLGFGAIVCALACGAGEEDQAPSAPDEPDKPRVELPPPGDQLSPVCDDSPLAKCPDDPGGMKPAEPPPTPPSETDQARARVESLLQTNCGQCHGSNLSLSTASVGI